jgi:hypothetical protein
MERNDEWQQMCEEREQMTEEAFIRARSGAANENDWKWLANELGLTLYKKERKYADL